MIRHDRPLADEALEPEPELGRAALALGLFFATGVAEGAFRFLRAAALERVDPASADVPGGAQAVAAWIALPDLPQAWVGALVAGGVLGAVPVLLARRPLPTPRPSVVAGGAALMRVTVTVCLALAAWVALGAGPLERMRTPEGGLALLVALAASALSVWLLGPLAARTAKPRSSWMLLVASAGILLSHGAWLVTRNAAPSRPAVETVAWLAHEPERVEVRGDVELDSFGSLRLGPGARIEGTSGRDATLRAWFVAPDGVREVVAEDGRLPALEGPGRLVDARWTRESRARSVRSSADEPSLITVAVDGLRARDVERLVAGPLPSWDRKLERLLQEALWIPDVFAPTADPAGAELALLTGLHPAELGRAVPPRHLGAALRAAGLRSRTGAADPPRPGVVGGFARRESGAVEFLRRHGEERFHLHLSFRSLTLEHLWESAGEQGAPERPAEPAELEAFVELVRAGVARRAMRAERATDEPLVSPEWRSWLDEALRDAACDVLIEVAWLYGELVELGLADRTRLVVVGTGGLALGEHGAFGTSANLHDESVRVPVLVLGPDLPTGSEPPFAADDRPGPTLLGARPLTDLAALLAHEMRVAWDGGAPRWSWDDPAPEAPIFGRLADGEWNGVPGREQFALRDDELTLLWCPAAEGDARALPHAGPWRLYRAEDRVEATDLSLAERFAEQAAELRAELQRRAAAAAAARAEADQALAAWERHGAPPPEEDGE